MKLGEETMHGVERVRERPMKDVLHTRQDCIKGTAGRELPKQARGVRQKLSSEDSKVPVARSILSFIPSKVLDQLGDGGVSMGNGNMLGSR